MIKEILLTTIVGSAGAVAIYLGDTRYVMEDTHESKIIELGDERYITLSSYTSGVNQRRVFELQDKIDDMQGRASYEKRKLTPYEQQKILEWKKQIRRLGG